MKHRMVVMMLGKVLDLRAYLSNADDLLNPV